MMRMKLENFNNRASSIGKNDTGLVASQQQRQHPEKGAKGTPKEDERAWQGPRGEEQHDQGRPGIWACASERQEKRQEKESQVGGANDDPHGFARLDPQCGKYPMLLCHANILVTGDCHKRIIIGQF